MNKNNDRNQQKNKPSFVALTPVNDVNIDKYEEALRFALEDSCVNNIALTGPYGSGKSTIIKTFEKKNKSTYTFLNISLASFKEIKDPHATKTEKETEETNNPAQDDTLIERSILQQMLYSTDSNTLAFSRFTRIRIPSYSVIKALFILLWILSLLTIYYFKNEAFSLSYWTWKWVFETTVVTYALSYLIMLFAMLYEAYFGLSFKKLSLKNMEIERGDVPENSILNRHLDEIIYFFQSTAYNVVVIEDLDRFGSPEIFVKLREINTLINANKKNRMNVKFLYALKDDMFTHKSRVKFFDFIIPVVPIINSSNSFEKIKERSEEYAFPEDVNFEIQFLREVSLYTDDLRLIHNIFNEFTIYYGRLKSAHLNVTKLLAMMIYKNVYPNDFEKLHSGEGVLYDICKKKPEYIAKKKEIFNADIVTCRKKLTLVEKENIRSIEELINTYIGNIVKKIPPNQPVSGLFINNQHLPFSQITSFEIFKPLLSEQNIQFINNLHLHPNYRISINKSFLQIQEEINPSETFLERKEYIENKSQVKQREIKNNIQKLEIERDQLTHKSLHLILQDQDINGLIPIKKISNGQLLVYLVKNGYLDENYHDYISNFHEGSLSKHDRDFLLTIRNFHQPDPNQRIDTPEEVRENMREEDFSQAYALNVKLIDYLLVTKKLEKKNIEQVIIYISHNFEKSEAFFTAYFDNNKHWEKFIHTLSHQWAGFVKEALSSIHSVKFTSYILRFVETDHITNQMNQDNVLTKFISQNGQAILASNHPYLDHSDVLKKLGVRFEDLESLEQNTALVAFAHAEQLYTMNTANILFILRTFAHPQIPNSLEYETANYTFILKVGSESLQKHISNHLEDYLEKVFLTLPNNIEESANTIKVIINNELISTELKERVLSKQEYIFETFAGLPNTLWSYLLLKEKITMTWKNIANYFEITENLDEEAGEDLDDNTLTQVFTKSHIVNTLSKEKISDAGLNDEVRLSLSRFILRNDQLNSTSYRLLIKILPYSFRSFPENISNDKLLCLAKERVVQLNEDCFKFSENNKPLLTLLINQNFSEYQNNKNNYPIGDDIRELLLTSEIPDEHKILICQDITIEGARSSKQLSRLIADTLIKTNDSCAKISDDVLSSAIINAERVSDSIQLILKRIADWDEEPVMDILAELPSPFNNISMYGKHPKIEHNKLNLKFAKALKERDFISSIDTERKEIKIHTFKSIDHD